MYQLETADKASLIERKIRVNWLPAGPDVEAHRPMSTPNKAAVANGVSIGIADPRYFV